jgi:hypothetical protein
MKVYTTFILTSSASITQGSSPADYLSRCTPKGAYPFGLALFAWIGV